MPYPYALDHDQAANAAALAAAGGAEVIAQADLSTDRLTRLIADAMGKPEAMSTMAAGARKAGKPEATQLLAGLVEAIAGGKSVVQFKGERP